MVANSLIPCRLRSRRKNWQELSNRTFDCAELLGINLWPFYEWKTTFERILIFKFIYFLIFIDFLDLLHFQVVTFRWVFCLFLCIHVVWWSINWLSCWGKHSVKNYKIFQIFWIFLHEYSTLKWLIMWLWQVKFMCQWQKIYFTSFIR